MQFISIQDNQWQEVKKIYLEAFPKPERKPFFMIKNSVKKGKTQLLVAMNHNVIHGFIIVTPYKDKLMVDYLAVSCNSRGNGIGSYIIQELCKRFSDKKIILLIEQLDDNAENKEQRIARRKFYIKNAFTTSHMFITGSSGTMEILNWGGEIAPREYIELQKYALGWICFKLSRIKLQA